MAAFTPATIPHNGQRVRGYQAVCGHCGVRAQVPVNSFRSSSSGEKEIDFTTKKFRERGWKIGNSESQNRCPACFASARNAVAKRKEAAVESPVIPIHAKADDPKPMGRDDRRIIFEKLNEVYADEKTGYSPGWTDSKVADDLGVPRAWVKQVRDEMFGPEGNEEIRRALTEAKELLVEAKKVGPATEQVLTSIRALLARAEKIERTVIDIERALR